MPSFADGFVVSNSSAASAPVRDDAKGIKLRYVARPPIFDRDEKVLGYELLFRDGMENVFHGSDANVASRSTLDSSLLVDLDILCDGRGAFLNCTRNTLIGGLVTLLPSHSTVVEVLLTVPVDAEVAKTCQRLPDT